SICRAKNKTPPCHRRRSFHPGSTFKILRMARRSHYRETRYADPLASERISVVLEMEVSTRRRPRVPLEVRKLIGEMSGNAGKKIIEITFSGLRIAGVVSPFVQFRE